MRLNKYQRAWIKRLMSGRSRKYKDRLFGNYPESNCCLGVAVRTCKHVGLKDIDIKTISMEFTPFDLRDFPQVFQELKLRDKTGAICQSKINKKWTKFFKYNDIDCYSLTSLNDLSNMSHKEIGRFINENREAVFTN